MNTGVQGAMAYGIDGIDHAVVAVADLEAARDRFQQLGFAITPRRRFIDWGTANYSVMFPNDFIELLGIIDPAAFLTPGLEDFLVGGEGAMAVTLRANDVTRAHALLTNAGCDPTPLNEMTINCEAPGGVLPQAFRWLRIGDAATPGMYLMLVQPLTPQNMRRPQWLAHPNGAQGIRSITIVVTDPERIVPAYARLFGAAATKRVDGDYAIFTGRGEFHFVTPQGLAARYGPHIGQGGRNPPFMAAVSLEVGDLEQARGAVEAGGATVEADAPGFFVPPDQACGVRLEFAVSG